MSTSAPAALKGLDDQEKAIVSELTVTLASALALLGRLTLIRETRNSEVNQLIAYASQLGSLLEAQKETAS